MQINGRLFSNGNKKIGKDTLIFNITPYKYCPAKKMCYMRNKCYAKRAEIQYKPVLPYRMRQMKYWNNVSVFAFCAEIMSIRSRRQNVIRYLRLNESGDFKNQEDVEKTCEIAELLSRYGMTTYTYTARKDLDFRNLPDSLTINGSSFMLDNQFIVVDKRYKSVKGDIMCKMDCSNCMYCKEKRGLVIKCREH